METTNKKTSIIGGNSVTATPEPLIINTKTGSRPVSEKDIRILENLYAGYNACKESSHNLGIVLEDMAEKLDYNGQGIFIHDLHYVVEARRCIRAIIESIDGLEPDFENITVKS